MSWRVGSRIPVDARLHALIQDALAHLKTHDLEVLGEETDRVMALPKKTPMSVVSAQLPTDDPEGADADEETDPPLM